MVVPVSSKCGACCPIIVYSIPHAHLPFNGIQLGCTATVDMEYFMCRMVFATCCIEGSNAAAKR